jgi:hypothetical protein
VLYRVATPNRKVTADMSSHARPRRLIVTALAAALTFCALTATAHARAEYRGVQLHSLWWANSRATEIRELDLAQAAGANVIRIDVSWSDIEWRKDQRSGVYVNRLDWFINAAFARGMKIVGTLWTTPCWASSARPSIKNGCNQNAYWAATGATYAPVASARSHYAATAAWLADRYRGRLAGIEVWNEPNWKQLYWKTPDTAGDYTALLKATFPAVKAVDPSLPILAGALAGSDSAFLKRMYADHPFADPGYVQLTALHKVQLAAGDRTPIWATEFGAPTGQNKQWHVTPQEQARVISDGFARFDATDYIAAAIVYNLRDKGRNVSAIDDNFGVLYNDFKPKPGYAAMKAGIAGHYSVIPRKKPRKRVVLRLQLSRSGSRVTAVGRGAPARAKVRVRFAPTQSRTRIVVVRASRRGTFRAVVRNAKGRVSVSAQVA